MDRSSFFTLWCPAENRHRQVQKWMSFLWQWLLEPPINTLSYSSVMFNCWCENGCTNRSCHDSATEKKKGCYRPCVKPLHHSLAEELGIAVILNAQQQKDLSLEIKWFANGLIPATVFIRMLRKIILKSNPLNENEQRLLRVPELSFLCPEGSWILGVHLVPPHVWCCQSVSLGSKNWIPTSRRAKESDMDQIFRSGHSLARIRLRPLIQWHNGPTLSQMHHSARHK